MDVGTLPSFLYIFQEFNVQPYALSDRALAGLEGIVHLEIWDAGLLLWMEQIAMYHYVVSGFAAIYVGSLFFFSLSPLVLPGASCPRSFSSRCPLLSWGLIFL